MELEMRRAVEKARSIQKEGEQRRAQDTDLQARPASGQEEQNSQEEEDEDDGGDAALVAQIRAIRLENERLKQSNAAIETGNHPTDHNLARLRPEPKPEPERP